MYTNTVPTTQKKIRVAGLSQRKPGFDLAPVYITFVLDKVALGQVLFLSPFSFPLLVSLRSCSILIQSSNMDVSSP